MFEVLRGEKGCAGCVLVQVGSWVEMWQRPIAMKAPIRTSLETSSSGSPEGLSYGRRSMVIEMTLEEFEQWKEMEVASVTGDFEDVTLDAE